MGLRPMVSSMMRSKTRPVLVALQIAVTLAIVSNSLFIIQQRVEKMNRDPGIDVRGFGADFDVVASITNDIDLIKSIPGVVAATVSNHAPLSGSGSGTGLCTVPDETIPPTSTARYEWSEEGLDALGVELARGRNFFAEEVLFDTPKRTSRCPRSSSHRRWRTRCSARMWMPSARPSTGAACSRRRLSASSTTCTARG